MSERSERMDCSKFGICGGCKHLELSYEESIGTKASQAREVLGAVIMPYQKDWDLDSVEPSPDIYGYRNKMEFSFGDEVKDGPLTLGMHRKKSFYSVVDAAECLLTDEDYHRITAAVRDYFGELYGRKAVDIYHKKLHRGYLRHLLLRKGRNTGEIMIALVTSSDTEVLCGGQASEDGILDTLKDLLLGLKLTGNITGILHIVNDSLSDTVKADRIDVLFGRDYFYEEILGLRFKITPFSFFQTNSRGAELLYTKAREYLLSAGDELGRVYDLYSGTGTISQVLSKAAEHVYAVEIVGEAVEAAGENAALNGIDNCTFMCGDVMAALDNMPGLPDTIVVDPPREGLHPKALRKIISLGVENILYISCKYKSLANELPAFMEHGYRIKKSCLVDMFPWTDNVETVCLLSNRKADSHIKLSLDMDEYYDIIEKEQAENK